MTESFQNAHQLISLIYETAEDAELWPKLLRSYMSEFIELQHTSGQYEPNHHFASELNELAQLEYSLKNIDASSFDENTFDEADFSVHFQRALSMCEKLDNAKTEAGSAKRVLDYLPVAIITVTPGRQVLSSNAIAQKIINNQRDEFLAVDNAETLRIKPDFYNHQLTQIISAALGKKKELKKSSFKMDIHNGDASVSIFAMKSTGESGQDICTLFITTNFWPEHVSVDALKQVYGLTPAESRLAKMLVRGESLSVTAEKLGVTHNTVRNQLKSIFAKTDTNRQSELVGLILSTPHFASDIQANTVANDKQIDPVNEQIKRITLSRGGDLVFIELGVPNGIPVFYFHEFIAWSWWRHYTQDDFESLNVRLIVPMRPGYRGTYFNAHLSFEQWAKDISELATHLGIEEYYCIGFSTGTAFAVSMPYYWPQACRGLALVSAITPTQSLADIEDVRPSISRLVIGFAKYTPSLYRHLMGGVLRTAYFNADRYVNNYVNQWSDYDRDLMVKPEVLEGFRECFLQVMNSDPTGLVNEALLYSKLWPFELEKISVPVDIWRGDDDRASSPKLAKAFTQIPNSREYNLPNRGHLLIFDHWQEVIRTLLTGPSKASPAKEALRSQ